MTIDDELFEIQSQIAKQRVPAGTNLEEWASQWIPRTASVRAGDAIPPKVRFHTGVLQPKYQQLIHDAYNACREEAMRIVSVFLWRVGIEGDVRIQLDLSERSADNAGYCRMPFPGTV